MEAWARGQWGERLEVQVEREGTFLSKRQGYLSKNSQENSIESTQTYCSGIMAQVYFLLSKRYYGRFSKLLRCLYRFNFAISGSFNA